MTSGPYEFSVIIPTYARPQLLRRCLQSVSHLQYRRGGFEVIVVDDGGPEPLDHVVRPFSDQLEVTLLRQANGGPGSARNAGAAIARGRFLAFTDDDCRPAPDWLFRLRARFEQTPAHLVGGQTINRLTRNPYSIASQVIIDIVYAYYNQRSEPAGFFTANNMALPTETFRQINGFDTEFVRSAAEDREICDRWQKLGYKMVYAPEARIYHVHELELHSFAKQHFTYGRGAKRYHELRALHGRRRLSHDVQFHLQLAQRLCNPTPGRRRTLAARVSGALILSQLVYVAGFFYEHHRSLQTALRTALVAPGQEH